MSCAAPTCEGSRGAAPSGGLRARRRGLEVRAGFDAKQYNVSANTEPGDRYVATGSSDLYLAGTVGVAWRD